MMNLLLSEQNLTLPTCSDNRGSCCTKLLKVSVLSIKFLIVFYSIFYDILSTFDALSIFSTFFLNTEQFPSIIY